MIIFVHFYFPFSVHCYIIIYKAEKKKYQEKLRADGKVSKKQEIEKRRKKIKALLEQDFKRKDICSQLDISIKTYKRDISFLKEQGLI